MDSHGAFASALLERSGSGAPATGRRDQAGVADGFDPKMQALMHIARTVRREPLDLTAADVAAALDAGASDQDVQLAVLIAAAFSMYNRIVEGFRAGPRRLRGLSGTSPQIASTATATVAWPAGPSGSEEADRPVPPFGPAGLWIVSRAVRPNEP